MTFRKVIPTLLVAAATLAFDASPFTAGFCCGVAVAHLVLWLVLRG